MGAWVETLFELVLISDNPLAGLRSVADGSASRGVTSEATEALPCSVFGAELGVASCAAVDVVGDGAGDVADVRGCDTEGSAGAGEASVWLTVFTSGDEADADASLPARETR